MGLLEGKVAVVTGGASGMGAATAELFAKNGAQVVVADIDEAGGRQEVEKIRENGGEATFVLADVSLEEDVRRMVEEIVAAYGRLDCAVNNAAMIPDDRMIVDMEVDVMDRLIAVDLRGVALCMKYEIRQMLAQGGGGAIVNISSMHGLRPQPISPNYVTAKRGVIGLTQNVAIDYAEKGIRVNALAPGAIITPVLRNSIDHFGFDPVEYARQLSMLGRFAEPDEIAEGSMWLCSDEASFVTGVTLPVDGGYTAM